MKDTQGNPCRLKDYKEPEFLVTHTELTIDLTKEPIQVKSRLTITSKSEHTDVARKLILDGENMSLMLLRLNDTLLEEKDYTLTDNSLTIHNVPQDKVFYIETEAQLGVNNTLFGLYKTEGTYLVKAETQGLRRVIYCMDRPDVLSTYEATIIANANEYPTLLSNGRLKEEKLSFNTKAATWLDETPKPSYLFALVAGNLALFSTPYVTKSGHKLSIDFFVDKDHINKCHFAKSILQQAMRWDEETYGLECALSSHKVTGVNKYSSGASETTGLNLFNTENLFASPEFKLDIDFLKIAKVVSHEYFHYWTGNRVTIRDWFNLSFKEGLATFRATEFCEHMFGSDLIRIKNGKCLNATSPRPDSYTAVRSLYTPAVYAKSSEIFRMIKTTIGASNFYTGMNQFLRENDGKAVTIENLLTSLQQLTPINLLSFLPWFTTAGIPKLHVSDAYDAEAKKYTLRVRQLGTSEDYVVRPIPLKFGLLDKQGKEIVEDRTVMIESQEQLIEFEGIQSHPIPSLLRQFSAPVELIYDYCESDLCILMEHDTDLFNRCEAARKIIFNLVELYCSDKKIELSPGFFKAYQALLQDETINPWVLAEIIQIPNETALFSKGEGYDLDKAYAGRELIVNALARELMPDFKLCLTRTHQKSTYPSLALEGFDICAASKRKLESVCLQYLSRVEPQNMMQHALHQFNVSLGTNMTNTVNALTLLCDMNGPEASEALNKYYAYWRQDLIAINYWFSIQASVRSPHVISDVRKLMQDPAFELTNPNKLLALMTPFLTNPFGFHAANGEGYQLIAEIILVLDENMPQQGVNLAKHLVNWGNYDAKRQQLMHTQVEFLSKNVKSVGIREIIIGALDKPCKMHSHMFEQPQVKLESPKYGSKLKANSIFTQTSPNVDLQKTKAHRDKQKCCAIF